MIIQAYNREETSLLKGFGILTIVAHNYFHWIQPISGENEFFFNIKFFKSFLTYLFESPSDFIHLFFSYFGHYGVQIFIFLSAYGLTMSYNKSYVSYNSFIFNRISKLYPAFLISFFFYLILYPLRGQVLSDIIYEGILKILLLSNFIPGKGLSLSGPWWFFVMIVQFYFVFPFIMDAYRKHGNRFLVIMSVFSLFLLVWINPFLESHDLSIRFFFFSYFPELSMGIYLATKKEINIDNKLILLLLFVFILGNFNHIAWGVSLISVLVLFLALFQLYLKYLKEIRVLNSFIIFFGNISFYLFLVHGFLRDPWVSYANRLGSPLYTLLLFIPFLIISIVVSMGTKYLDYKMRGSIVNHSCPK